MSEKVTVKVCATCGQRGGIGKAQKFKDGKVVWEGEACAICGGTTFKTVDYPDKVTCVYCKKEWKVEDVLKQWIDVPFFDSTNNTFYCGCRGWD